MQIQSGKLYENKTWKYLYPSLKMYGDTLKKHLNSFFKLAIGVGDHNIQELKEPCIFILFDTKKHDPKLTVTQYRASFDSFLEWVRLQPYYVKDYLYGGIDIREQHMLVLRLPKGFEDSYIKFKGGLYSEMYSQAIQNILFEKVNLSNKEIENRVNDRIEGIVKVLNRNFSIAGDFLKNLNKEFGTTLKIEDIKNHQYDLPPFQWEEVFNYKPNQDGTRIKI